MRRNWIRFLVTAAGLFSAFAALANSPQTTMVYDHGAQRWTCDGGTPQIAPCVATVNEGNVVSVTITNALPGLFSYLIEKKDREPEGLSNALAKKLGIPTDQPAATGGGTQTAGASTGPNIDQLYQNLLASLRAFRASVLKPNFPGYQDKLTALRSAHDALLAGLRQDKTLASGTTAGSDVLKALKVKSVGISLTDDAFVTFWGHLEDLIADAPDTPTNGPSASFDYDDRDFDIVITIKALNPLLANPDIESRASVRLAHAFRVLTTTGLALSGLVDDHYTVVTETVNGTDVRKARAERSDKISIPEATLFIHLTPFGSYSRLAASVGIGIASNASGRMYAGLSWRLGTAGALTFGVAGGNVKRLSRNVDVNNLGTVDPEATRRDVYRTSYMFGISWRLTGK